MKIREWSKKVISLLDTVLPPVHLDAVNLDALVKTPPAVSVPISSEVRAQMEELSTTFFKDGVRFTVTFGRGTEPFSAAISSPITPDKEFSVGEGRQANRPNCGPETLAMVLQGYDLHVSSEDIEGMSNFTFVSGTSPNSLRDVARQYGFNSVILNNSNFNEISSIIDKGGVCIALIESGPALHYVAINGYKRGENGENRFFIADPGGAKYSVLESEFANEWKNVKFRGFDTGFSKGVIAIAKDDILPAERFDGKAAMLSGLHSFLNTTLNSGPVLIGLSLLALLKLRRKEPKDENVRAGSGAIPAAA